MYFYIILGEGNPKLLEHIGVSGYFIEGTWGSEDNVFSDAWFGVNAGGYGRRDVGQ